MSRPFTFGSLFAGIGGLYSGEHPDALRDMPLEIASWNAFEQGIPRVANKVPSRVDRLRGLGNAVVPQVAEWIGKQIVQSETKK